MNPKTNLVPAVFHNLHGYESDLLMQVISKVEGDVSYIPINTEQYVSFTLGQLCFIDSAQFWQAPECMVVQKQWMSEYQHNLLSVGLV